MSKDRDEFDVFRYEDCNLCGECLSKCRYLGLNVTGAVEEMKRLIAGEPTRTVHSRCISCYACDAFCPHDCHPYELILKTWHERYRKQGLPVRAAYLMPTSSPNFRTDMVGTMAPREQSLLRKWEATPPEGDLVLFPGCNLLTMPHLVDAPFMEGIVISGDLDLCCGEMFFRMGLFDEVKRTAEKLTRYYRDREIGTMLFVCPAGLNMFRNVLPRFFGAEFSFETRFLGDYLWDKVSAGEIELTGKLDHSIAVHDSCHGRILGDEVTGSTRKLYAAMGLELRELVTDLREGLCCGMAAGSRRCRPDDMFLAAVKELQAAAKTGADQLSTYCTGCRLMLDMMRWLYPTRQPVRHLLEYLKQATGDATVHRTHARTLRMLANVVIHALPHLLSRETCRIEV
ncbi:MAG: (Fe-S)-binding protein [Deltaproteobacteria bacterium]|nr:(Fe-S)-binding protein [Deltaproteobacteria bacterium]